MIVTTVKNRDEQQKKQIERKNRDAFVVHRCRWRRRHRCCHSIEDWKTTPPY